MKLLLTSAGLTNNTIINTLKNMVGTNEIKTAFIPTAANIEEGDKTWLIKNLEEFQKIGFIDIIDISALSKDIWLKRIQDANIIVVGGGDTSHLMNEMKKSGFDKEINTFLKEKVYVGISAGSIVTNKKLWCSSEFLFGDETGEVIDGLGIVNFNFRPHLNSIHFPKVRDKNLSKIAQENPGELIYALDDNSAIKVIGDSIEIITEGERKKYNC